MVPTEQKIAIGMDQFTWKKKADLTNTNEPYVLSVAIDEHTLTDGEHPRPFFNPIVFENVTVGQTVQMLGHGHLFYGPRYPGAFVALMILWMESDQKTRDLGKMLQALKTDTTLAKLTSTISTVASTGATAIMPILLQAINAIGTVLAKNKDDVIYGTTGAFLRDVSPSFMVGSSVQRGNQFIDFNVKVIGV